MYVAFVAVYVAFDLKATSKAKFFPRKRPKKKKYKISPKSKKTSFPRSRSTIRDPKTTKKRPKRDQRAVFHKSTDC